MLSIETNSETLVNICIVVVLCVAIFIAIFISWKLAVAIIFLMHMANGLAKEGYIILIVSTTWYAFANWGVL